MIERESKVSQLEKEGWNKRFVASEPRLSEAVEMYQEIGLEVHLEPLSKDPSCDGSNDPEEKDDCRVCYEGHENQYKIIFTKPKEASNSSTK